MDELSPQKELKAASAALEAIDSDPPLVGIIRNPRSHRNLTRALYYPSLPHLMVEAPRDREELGQVLAEFARRGIKFLAISGGDGTVRDVLTYGQPVFGDEWPELIVLPRGKTNALGVDLGLKSGWSLAEAIQAIADGKRIVRQPIVIRKRGAANAGVVGFVLGTGAFARGTELGQETHRRGAFQSFAVGLTILWSVLQIVFGRDDNAWRQSTRLRLTDGPHGPELPHSRRGNPGERFLVFLSTLQNFPLGVRPFGKAREDGLQIAILDTPSRGGLLLLPLFLTGYHARWVSRLGFTRPVRESLGFEIAEPFVVDGEFFPAGDYDITRGPRLSFVVP